MSSALQVSDFHRTHFVEGSYVLRAKHLAVAGLGTPTRLRQEMIRASLVRCNISRHSRGRLHARRTGNATTFVVLASASSRSAHHCIIFLRSGRYSAAL
jgi:hypothetical protein